MELKDWCVYNNFAEDVYKAVAALGLEEPSDLAYAFASQAEAEAACLGAPWLVARRNAKACAYTAGVQLMRERV